MQGLVTIDSVIRLACEEIEDINLSKYRKFEMWALESLKELRIDTCPELKIVKLKIDTYTCAVPFPVDMAKWIRLGEKEGDRMKPFIVDEALIMTNDKDDCGQPIRNPEYRPDYGWAGDLLGYEPQAGLFYNYGYYADSSAASYGFGGGYLNDGHFKEDRSNRRWVFASQYANKEIYVEYVSNGIDPTKAATVDDVISKAVKYYILWRNTHNDKTASPFDKQTAKAEYYEEERKAFRRVCTITPDKLITLWRDTLKQTPKG